MISPNGTSLGISLALDLHHRRWTFRCACEFLIIVHLSTLHVNNTCSDQCRTNTVMMGILQCFFLALLSRLTEDVHVGGITFVSSANRCTQE